MSLPVTEGAEEGDRKESLYARKPDDESLYGRCPFLACLGGPFAIEQAPKARSTSCSFLPLLPWVFHLETQLLCLAQLVQDKLTTLGLAGSQQEMSWKDPNPSMVSFKAIPKLFLRPPGHLVRPKAYLSQPVHFVLPNPSRGIRWSRS